MKTRMTKGLRITLKGIVVKEILRHDLEAELKAAYRAIADSVRAIVTAKYPSEDMAVLERYNLTTRDDCIMLRLSNGMVTQFRFEKRTGPLVAQHYTCSRRVYDPGPDDGQGKEVTRQFDTWSDLDKAFTAANKVLWNDYFALIDNARNLEEIEAVWPRVTSLIKRQPVTAISLVTPELIDRIKRDQAARVETASTSPEVAVDSTQDLPSQQRDVWI